MRTLPADLITELQKENLAIAHLVEITLSGPAYYRYTDLDEDVFYNGDQYYSRGLDFAGIELSITPQVDNVSFAIDNVDSAISAIVLNNDTRGKTCTIRRAAIDSNIQVISTATIFIGTLDRVEVDNQRGRFDVVNSAIKWQTKVPRRTHTATCPWTFKGSECAYAGAETWCDQSWDRCTTLVNTPQFGGFRFLPSLQDKEISWGKKL